jgi:SAM-dependent methyltransferase
VLRFVNKKELWKLYDSGVGDILGKAPFSSYQLKSAQDIIAMGALKDLSGKKIAEVGGGDSRLLPYLASANEVFNIDPSEGADNGPVRPAKQKGVQNILCNIGDSEHIIEDESYDMLFSISVVEHVNNDLLDSFFKDCHRILKPGGEMIHLIDIYVGTSELSENAYFEQRHKSYTEVFHHTDRGHVNFSSVSTRSNSIDDFCFRPEFATNPDSVMYAWRSIAPDLHEVRERAQLCTLLMHVAKI